MEQAKMKLEGKQSGVMYHNYNGDTKPATDHKNKIMPTNAEGRFPANIILECCCDELLDGGIVKSGSQSFKVLTTNSVAC